ncbi:hypothetical protein [Clostridium sp.]|uniref:hypothetical protein n=1 Tax=Clostridium sp. TaxID=1506 RepID=UPI0032179AB4
MLNNNEFFYYDENNERDYSAEIFAQDFGYGQQDGIDFGQESYRNRDRDRDGKWRHDCKSSHHRPCNNKSCHQCWHQCNKCHDWDDCNKCHHSNDCNDCNDCHDDCHRCHRCHDDCHCCHRCNDCHHCSHHNRCSDEDDFFIIILLFFFCWCPFGFGGFFF